MSVYHILVKHTKHCYAYPMREVVIAAIFNEDKLLVAQRLSDPFKGYWECPGGKVEAGESLFEALIREIQEEGAVTIKRAEVMFDYIVETTLGPIHITWFETVLETSFKPIIYTQLYFIKKEEVDALSWIPHNIPHLQKLKTFFPTQT